MGTQKLMEAPPLPLHSQLPIRTSRVNKNLSIGVGAVAVLLLAVSLMDFGGKAPEPEDNEGRNSTPSSVIASLPKNYSEIPVAPLPTIAPTVSSVTEPRRRTAQLGKSAPDERAQRAARAKEGSMTFEGLSSVSERATQGGRGQGAGPGNGLPSSLGSLDNLTPGASGNPRDEHNRQDEKIAYLEATRDAGTLLNKKLRSPVSDFQISAGTMIPGLLLTGINSDLPGQIYGQVSQNIFDSVTGRYLLIPQGTRMLGQYDSRVAYGQERVLIVWTRIILPNGRSISLEGMPGTDLSGYAGLSDQVNNHYLKLATGVLFGSLLGAGAQIAAGPQSALNPSFGELAAQGVAQNTNQAGQEITRKNLNIQPTLEIRPGFRFNIFVTKDVVLEEYQPL